MHWIEQRLSQIFRWAVAERYGTDNPRRISPPCRRARLRPRSPRWGTAGPGREPTPPSSSSSQRPTGPARSGCRSGAKSTWIPQYGPSRRTDPRHVASTKSRWLREHCTFPEWIPLIIPRLLRGAGPAVRGCRGVPGTCRQEQGRGGLRAIGPDQATSDTDGGLGGVPLAGCRPRPRGPRIGSCVSKPPEIGPHMRNRALRGGHSRDLSLREVRTSLEDRRGVEPMLPSRNAPLIGCPVRGGVRCLFATGLDCRSVPGLHLLRTH